MERNIDEYLGELGLSETESQLYLDLLEIGPCSIADLTRKSGIPRTTVRENIDRLAQKGLMSQTFEGARKKLVAEEPNKVKLLIMDRKLDLENRKDELDKMEKNFGDFVSSLRDRIPNMVESNAAEVTVRYFKGKEEVFNFYKETLEASDVRSFVHLDKFYQVYPDAGNIFDEALENNKEREVWDIAVDTGFARDVNQPERYHKKYMPKGPLNSGFDIIIFDNSLAIISLEESNLNATVVTSINLAQALREIHSLLWKLL